MMNICSTCQGAQSECQERLDASSDYRAEVNTHLSPSSSPTSSGDWWNKNFLWILVEEIGLDALRERVKRPLGAPDRTFYGCYIVRPTQRLGFDQRPERDVYLEQLIEALGAGSAARGRCAGVILQPHQRVAALDEPVRVAGRHRGLVGDLEERDAVLGRHHRCRLTRGSAGSAGWSRNTSSNACEIESISAAKRPGMWSAPNIRKNAACCSYVGVGSAPTERGSS